MKKIKGIEIKSQFIYYACSQELLWYSAGVSRGEVKV